MEKGKKGVVNSLLLITVLGEHYLTVPKRGQTLSKASDRTTVTDSPRPDRPK
jgi:hypothetical protein